MTAMQLTAALDVTSGMWRRSGETGIRTLGHLAESPVFKTGAIGRSAISPSEHFFLANGRVSFTLPRGLTPHLTPVTLLAT